MSHLSKHLAGLCIAQPCVKLGNRWTCSRVRNFPGKGLEWERETILLFSILKGDFTSSVLLCDISFSDFKRMCSMLHATTSSVGPHLAREVYICRSTKRNASITTYLASCSNVATGFQAHRSV